MASWRIFSCKASLPTVVLSTALPSCGNHWGEADPFEIGLNLFEGSCLRSSRNAVRHHPGRVFILLRLLRPKRIAVHFARAAYIDLDGET